MTRRVRMGGMKKKITETKKPAKKTPKHVCVPTICTITLHDENAAHALADKIATCFEGYKRHQVKEMNNTKKIGPIYWELDIEFSGPIEESTAYALQLYSDGFQDGWSGKQ